MTTLHGGQSRWCSSQQEIGIEEQSISVPNPPAPLSNHASNLQECRCFLLRRRYIIYIPCIIYIYNRFTRKTIGVVLVNPAHGCLNKKIEISLSLFAPEELPSRVSVLIPRIQGKPGVCIVNAHFNIKSWFGKRETHITCCLVPAYFAQGVSVMATQLRDPIYSGLTRWR